MKRLTISQYLKRDDSYPVTPATVRRYVDSGILQGEKVKAGKKTTYYIHLDTPDELYSRMVAG